MEKKRELALKFAEIFGDQETTQYFSPGRINLIGEHTDYNGGYVFPASITYGTYGVARRREDDRVFVYSTNFKEVGVIRFKLNELGYDKNDNWANYVKGVLLTLKEAGHKIDSGFELLVEGTIPNGAGLSSSASLELLVGVVLEHLFNLDVTRLELVKMGKKVENEFIGVNSGIMDQFAIGFGEEDKAILLDTNTLKYEMVPVVLNDYAIVIMNTNKRRELADSKYNERRAECEEALARLQTKLEITALGELSETEFDANQDLIGDEVLIRRAKHAVYENERTKKAKEALTANDLEEFGKLLNASHASLRDDYEVTGVELDTLVAAAQKQEGVLGARMTGAGFGGCAIALVKESEIRAFKNKVYDEYLKVIGYAPVFYVAHIGCGTTVIG
ncbi:MULTISPECIES: galactokinase [Bacillus cereus group]|uniref:Galactokinase n=1 Tax=Bacillus thuringiensis serovar mexicanensis TaxID=180868 RepID=A0A242WAE8_BACTU|nr:MULTISPECIES: galactokinase [Bacillus cereus group]EEM56547.1 Galactokinase [Bacillus thuringiensis serovar monterrey BGSC 4AJ1]MEB9672406.1 galactokinase [Bacillus anthracis]OTW46229.1 galactokinase [Bacillus thuringiensis serovar mexicanensis]OTW50454.1 galactokinase [Bacillus thuringiensis serovar mexicanensis]OTW54932.1 galactokinase [Bacillus thuringiensis serovar mexicanensis]